MIIKEADSDECNLKEDDIHNGAFSFRVAVVEELGPVVMFVIERHGANHLKMGQFLSTRSIDQIVQF